MPSNSYQLPGIDEMLIVSWDGRWNGLTITLGNQLVGRSNGGATALRQGLQFELADGSRLSLKLTDAAGPDALLVRRNGRPLLASRGRDLQALSRAAIVLFLIALVNIVLGLISMFGGARYDALGIVGSGSVISGGVLLALALAFRRRRGLAPLVAAIGVYTLDGVFGYATVVQMGGEPGIIGYIARAWFLYYLVQAAFILRTESPGGDEAS